jgi:hypothetical protein
MSDFDFDFGFTIVDENEIEAVQQAQEVANEQGSTVSELQDKVDKMYNAILPLLNNLKLNPEREYILWPNRIEKVEQFEDYLQKIYKS